MLPPFRCRHRHGSDIKMDQFTGSSPYTLLPSSTWHPKSVSDCVPSPSRLYSTRGGTSRIDFSIDQSLVFHVPQLRRQYLLRYTPNGLFQFPRTVWSRAAGPAESVPSIYLRSASALSPPDKPAILSYSASFPLILPLRQFFLSQYEKRCASAQILSLIMLSLYNPPPPSIIMV